MASNQSLRRSNGKEVTQKGKGKSRSKSWHHGRIEEVKWKRVSQAIEEAFRRLEEND